jgi:translation initiation factor 1A
MKRRVRIREGEIVIVSPWDFQSESRGDITWKHTGAQEEKLKKRGELQKGVSSA